MIFVEIISIKMDVREASLESEKIVRGVLKKSKSGNESKVR